MALSLSFPSTKTDSGQSIFKTKKESENTAQLADENDGVNMSHDQKPWKSTPSLIVSQKPSGDNPPVAKRREGGIGGESTVKSSTGMVGVTSFIPVPKSRRPPPPPPPPEKSALVLENLISSKSKSDSAKGLPDLTESPQTPFGSSDKPCDLLAQLEIVKRQREMETSGRESSTGESDSVDDNGNPVDGGEVCENPQSINEECLKGESNDMSQTLKDNQEKGHTGTQQDITTPLAQRSFEKKLIEGSLQENSEKVPIEKSPDEPKYFINAAALSEDNFELPPSPAPSPCSSQFNSLSYLDPYPSLCPFVPDNCLDKSDHGVNPTDKTVIKSLPEKAVAASSIPVKGKYQGSKSPPREAVVRPRVPVSKSFPDIVQTTFSSEEKGSHQLSGKTTKDNSDTESLVADSLEELRQVETTDKVTVANPLNICTSMKGAQADKPLKAFEQPLTSSYGLDPAMTESQLGGISAEKPPEAWVIDFNSLSLESDLMEQSARERKSSMGSSNPSSLAFFVNLDDKTETGTPRDMSEAVSTPEKKIFTMFVDLGAEKEDGFSQSQTRSSDSESLMSASMTMESGKRSSGIINKPVVNVMETSGIGLKSPLNRRFPSPIFQHRAAAEANRKAARMELHKERDKFPPHPKEQFLDSLEPHSTNFMAMCPRNDTDIMIKSQLIDSTSSNRSSLHVANVLDASFTSSLLSSMENSSPADMEVCQGGPCFKLGKDLLRMFQEGINTDVNIMVNGKCIKAHKCILASRSQYFAAILSGNWVENAGNTINLDGFSYSVVQFTLYHVYSGTNEIPDTIDLLELATLTDLLGLEGLRENISQTIRHKFCHNFHRPCTGCISGVIECFPIALAYGMDELHRKMTKWICKHFVRIWPTKAFANLGDELIEKCLRYSVNHLSVDNILDHTLGCDQLLTTMPTVRWTEAIFSIVGQLSEACVQYIGEHFCEVMQSEKFLLFGKGQTWNISRIEGTFMEALNLLKPDEACVSHTALSRLIELGTETIDEVEWSTLFVDFLKLLRGEIERYLLANASKAVLSKGWEQLGQDVRKKICTSSFMGFDKYGNKIGKNQGTGSGSSHGHGHATTTVPVQNVKPTSKDKHGHYSSVRSSKSVSKQMSVPVTTTVSKEPNKEPILSPMTANPAKVASVRPMQAAKQNISKPASAVPSNVAVTPTTKSRSSSSSLSGVHDARENKSLSRVTSHKSFTPPISTSHRNTPGAVPKKFTTAVEREKSFNNSTRPSSSVVSTSSARGTPLKPLTPSKTDSPITTHGASGTGTYGRSSVSRRTPRPPPTQPVQQPPVAPTKVFLTNSAKAAAVSKPILRGSTTGPTVSKRTPSSSATSLLSQQSATSSSKTSTVSSHAPPTSRYLSAKDNTKAGTGAGGFSARSSFSNVERPGPVKSKVMSNPPRRNTYSNAAAASAAGAANKNTSGSTGSTKRPLSGGTVGVSAATVTAPNKNMTEMQNNYAKDNVMSRSTIETDSGETKMRTLAEIGRSSTFSKDEPTILGKMDSSTYSTLEMEISP